MIKNKRISDLISDSSSPLKLSKIKDYSKVNEIFKAYLKEHYNYMAKEIFYYSDFWFFHDLTLYLHVNFKTDAYRDFFFRDINEMYEEKLEDVLYLKQIKKLKKQYGL